MNDVKKTKKNIYQKLVEVRKNIKSFKKDATGYGYKYVPGTQILSLIKEDIDRLGIVLETHLLNPIADKVEKRVWKEKIKAMVEETAYLITSDMKMVWVNADDPVDKIEISWFMTGEQKDPSQAFGSGLTYTERYFLLKFFGIPTDEDDPDKLPKGNNKTQGKTETDKSKKLVTEKQLKRLYAMEREAGLDIQKTDDYIKQKYQVDSKKELTMFQIDDIFAGLERRIKEKKEADKLADDFEKSEGKLKV